MVTDEVTYFGMRYIVPVMVDSLGVILAVNVGGAVIPTLLSIYLLSNYRQGAVTASPERRDKA